MVGCKGYKVDGKLRNQVTIRLSPKVIACIDVLARLGNMSRTEFIEDSVVSHVQRISKKLTSACEELGKKEVCTVGSPS
jgi:predicted transcriptional regulator